MRLYADAISGNCDKVVWTARQAGRSLEVVPVSVVDGDAQRAEFRAKFPFAQVPALELADGRTLAQSNAIMRYLARGSALLPDDPFTQAQIDQWLFWEQYSHEPYIAVCRYQKRFLKQAPEVWRVERGNRALDLMEQYLLGRTFFVSDALSIADIALVAYTRMAHEGGFDLATRPQVSAWVKRCEALLLH